MLLALGEDEAEKSIAPTAELVKSIGLKYVQGCPGGEHLYEIKSDIYCIKNVRWIDWSTAVVDHGAYRMDNFFSLANPDTQESQYRFENKKWKCLERAP